MKVIITGGGTGGHVYPAVSLAEELLRREADAKILFIGTKRGLENSILPKHGFHLKRICVGGLIGKTPVNTVISLLKLPVGFFQSFWILIIFRPDIVIGVPTFTPSSSARPRLTAISASPFARYHQ